ncbi:SigE family RNA polymerase sigma factor [Actinoplanes sp. RD1]|uniref:SigE family RNA polymerase sigma factor n=1 Tax=Actinoplanes sp. RD1 TaxID=3064538 RepID=UPI0027419B0B|nr:SigE family RNA polymerase sigma factor [Actinoplanes sp. RD1]
MALKGGTPEIGEGTGMRFEEFTAARLPALLRYAAALCGDSGEADDVVQEALTRALVRWKRIGDLAEPYAYVRTMVTNEFLARKRRRRFLLVPLDRHDPPARPPVRADPEVWAWLAGLPRQQRVVLVLRYYEGLSDDEIAEVLGCRPGTVRGYASRALASLRVTHTTEGVQA